MVENLQLEITSSELKGLLEGRMRFHAKKAEVLDAEVIRLGGVLEDLDDEAEEIGKYAFSNTNAGHQNPVTALRDKAKVHRDRATYFKFFAEHLIPNEKYLLSQSDLGTIEVCGGRGW